MRRANRALQMIRKCNSMLFRCEEEAEMLSSLCRIAVETGGYLMASVAFAEDDPGKTVRPVAQSGHDEGYLETAHFTWADTERGRGPTGTAVRTGRTVINQDIHTNPAMRPWLDQALARGYQSSVALPLVGDRRVLGALTIYAVEPHAFGDEEVSLLEELANELAYGIVSLRTRRAHEQHHRVLRKSLEQSIQTIADTVEARDPYTAGHQRRVAALAVAIAEEMDVPAEARNGLRLAATIHDLGKIGVPVEILAKPGKLTATEYEIIKTHPQHGHDILQDVEFPWPIADIILQHHERMDGSGYPQGLAGDAILPEARILAVADVVEAMASHRPYRAGLGIDAALEEVTRNRGRLYDEQVVDACLRLIRDHGYAIDG
jgi:HD-GYP domain-containing protein (c-di-GMP phosphodiesterase class II)